ncbi:hypothetical protein GCM10022378_09110 [Salinicoccus jeotgali]|uniref:Uncharacterized protein n=1 Tax=Salinicoccus jeotgali TaxID=381634 RepID=A0ABP7EM56_9STAP
MKLKSFELSEETISLIKTIKAAKNMKSEKQVIVEAVENYALSEMIEHQSAEYKMLEKMRDIENELKNLKRKINYIDHGVSVNNLFLASWFEIGKYPKAIINRRTLDGYYHDAARKEITKMIRERDAKNRISKQSEEKLETKEEVTEKKKADVTDDAPKKKDRIDELFGDDWLNI